MWHVRVDSDMRRSIQSARRQIKEGPISFTILSNGALLPDVPGYHTAEFVYPVGYKVFRRPDFTDRAFWVIIQR